MAVQIKTLAKAVDVSRCPAPQANDAQQAWVEEWDTWMVSAALSFHLSSSRTNYISKTGTHTD